MLYNLQDELSRQKFKTKVQFLWNNGTVVELTDKRRRTKNQNNYLHAILGALALETGYSPEVIKQDIFKRRVNPDLFVEETDNPILGKVETLRSTRLLNKEEMSVAIDRYIKFCSELGVYLPKPGDEEMIAQIECEISKASRYF